MSMATT